MLEFKVTEKVASRQALVVTQNVLNGLYHIRGV